MIWPVLPFKSEATPFKLWTCGIIKQLLAFIPYVIQTLPALYLKEGLLSSQRSRLSILRAKDDVPWIMSSSMLWSILLYSSPGTPGVNVSIQEF